MEINNKIITIFENDKYSLIGTNKAIEDPAITINMKLDNDIIYLGKIINDDTNREWIEVNDQAVAIIGESNFSKTQYIKILFYIPNKSFVYNNKDSKFAELFGIKNKEKQKIKTINK